MKEVGDKNRLPNGPVGEIIEAAGFIAHVIAYGATELFGHGVHRHHFGEPPVLPPQTPSIEDIVTSEDQTPDQPAV